MKKPNVTEENAGSVVSLLREDTIRNIDFDLVCEALADEIADNRGTVSVKEVVKSFSIKHGMNISEKDLGNISDKISNELTNKLNSDENFVDEYSLANIIVQNVLGEYFGLLANAPAKKKKTLRPKIAARGYFTGERIVRRGESFVLTGNVCEACGVNPEIYLTIGTSCLNNDCDGGSVGF